ncbi:MAG: excinuclease ABC subunit UvrC [Candidatus Levybacteria bacterium]|nr:excinuclease ABC subunit UvrC [Candidatus Levybacteria bacterium]
MEVQSSSYRSLSSDTGVYLFLDKEGQIIYVGKAVNLKQRVSSYFQNSANLGDKTKALVDRVVKIRTISVNSEVESFLLEEKLVKKHKPRFNIMLKDDKAYPLVKITFKEKFPAVLVVRKKDDTKSLYFGPYTSAASLKTVLKLLRRIFPYQSVEHHGSRLCLYYHLGLCPCPQVTGDTNYKKTIKHIIDFLNGSTKKVIKDLEKERDEYSKNEDFENSKMIQRKIDAITLITSPFYKPFVYEENPNFRQDVLQQSLNSLIEILNNNGVPVKKLERIECYDISNIQGKNATASMVVLRDGDKDTDSYRRFKIKGDYNGKPNDFAMMSEVLKRRFKHMDWPFPDLLVVDGGKGQVSTAVKALQELNLSVPLIGLAKREETIVTPSLEEIKLPKDSKALLMIIKIRDEAHRFAITYHKKLRSKFISY